MSRLPLRNMPIDLVMKVYNCFVLPIFQYGLPLYLSSCSSASRKAANASFTKFLKAYLGIPFHSNNAITHYITSTHPLLDTLENLAPHSLASLVFPPEINGHQLSFIKAQNQPHSYDPIPIIPSYFWRSKMFSKLPLNLHYRKKLCTEIYNLDHLILCDNQTFHILNYEQCRCLRCGVQMSHYHKYICEKYCDKI